VVVPTSWLEQLGGTQPGVVVAVAKREVVAVLRLRPEQARPDPFGSQETVLSPEAYERLSLVVEGLGTTPPPEARTANRDDYEDHVATYLLLLLDAAAIESVAATGGARSDQWVRDASAWFRRRWSPVPDLRMGQAWMAGRILQPPRTGLAPRWRRLEQWLVVLGIVDPPLSSPPPRPRSMREHALVVAGCMATMRRLPPHRVAEALAIGVRPGLEVDPEAYDTLVLPWSRAHAWERHLLKVEATGRSLGDEYDVWSLQSPGLLQTLFAPAATSSPIRLLEQGERLRTMLYRPATDGKKWQEWIEHSVHASEQRSWHTRPDPRGTSGLVAAVGSLTEAFERYAPPCLRRLAEEGRRREAARRPTDGSALKHDDRYRVGALFRAVGGRDPVEATRILTGRPHGPALPDLEYEMRNDTGCLPTCARLQHYQGPTLLLRCAFTDVENAHAACCRQAGFDPQQTERFASPAGYMVLMHERGKR